ncbi:alpha/beta hydrolase [Cyanobacteria bacterium FACHB-502]|nr:alpha/beta hydrolase [Cyanobacteria bacterium FACHB-502]
MVKTVDVLGFPHAYELFAPTDAPTDMPIVVFVHGWLLSRAYWQPVIEQLAGNYQCLAYDLRGFGHSQNFPNSAPAAQALPQNLTELDLTEPVPETVVQRTAVSVASPTSVAIDHPTLNREASSGASGSVPVSLPDQTAADQAEISSNRYTPAAYAQDLVHLLAELQIKKAWIVGHSLGGSIALWAAHLAPDTIEGVVCVNAGGGIYLKEEFERFRLAGEQLVKFRPRWLSYLPFLDLLLTRINVYRPIARRWAKQRLQDLLVANAEAALRSLLDSTTEAEVHQLPQVVAQLQQPVHFITGQKDTVMEPKYVRHLASFHPSFEFCGHNVSEISDCGHLAMIEQPDVTVAEIRAVLEKYSA